MGVTHAFSCACGWNHGSTTGVPLSVTWCHCVDCRRESGAPAMVWAGWRDEQIGGALDHLVVRRTKPNVTRSRCAECGSTLAYRDRGLPDRAYIPIGAFDAPDDLVPTEHGFWPEKIDWLSFDDGLRRREATTQSRVPASETTG